MEECRIIVFTGACGGSVQVSSIKVDFVTCGWLMEYELSVGYKFVGLCVIQMGEYKVIKICKWRFVGATKLKKLIKDIDL